MNSVSFYLKGWKLAFRNLKMWKLLYLLNFAIAGLLTLPFFQFLNKKLAHSMALDKVSSRFDFTVYHDFMNEYGDIVDFFINQTLVVSILFFVLSIFLVGGILNTFRNDSLFQFTGFWAGCSKYFWRIFWLTLIFIAFQGLLLFLFFSLFQYLIEGGLDRFHTEADIYYRAMIVFPIYLFFAILLWMFQDYAKVALVNKELSVFQSIKSGFQFVFRHFFPTFLLYFLVLSTFVLALYGYWSLPTFDTLLLTFGIGQLFLIFRIGMKLVNLGTASLWFRHKNMAIRT